MNKKRINIILGLIVGIAVIVGITTGFHENESPKKMEVLPDQNTIQEKIKQSIANYKGQCPCPYSLTKSGTRCGDRSAWSRKDGETTLCYESDLEPARYEWGLTKQETLSNSK